MPQEKRSFFSRLTGSQSGDELQQDMSMPIYSDDDQSENIEMGVSDQQDYAPRQQQQQHISQPMHEENRWVPETQNNDGEGQLTIDVFQTESEIVIKSTIAGVKPEDLDVAINNDMITIKGERRLEEEVTSEDYYYQECYWGSFSRSVVLPVDVVAEKAEASLKNGILTIRLPKADVHKMRKIQVRGF
ncbi:MAG: Hsp20/alpha crystallin family protein [Candidatus Moranbacteria bacterium]|nr:Hsp20/alpha crystallin family protein [Candidatus Moranbacteria bacterium]